MLPSFGSRAPNGDFARSVLASIGDAVITTDTTCVVTYLNPIAERLTGWRADEAVGVPLDQVLVLISEVDRQPLRHRARRCLEEERTIDLQGGAILIRRDGAEIPIGDSTAPIRDILGRTSGVVLVIQDESEQRRTGRKLSYEASHDPLTDLTNRREFERRLARVVADCRSTSGVHALLYLDLDDFKLANDLGGHSQGDEVLRSIGPLLRPLLRHRDTLARIGGDEFAILLERCPLDQAQRIAENVREAVEGMRFRVGDRELTFGASIGLVPLTSECTDLHEVIRSADAACYLAKQGGGNRVRLGSQELSRAPEPGRRWLGGEEPRSKRFR
jgi:diguanylate cyclase